MYLIGIWNSTAFETSSILRYYRKLEEQRNWRSLRFIYF